MSNAIILTRDEKEVLLEKIKIGILKELHRKNILTDSQTDRLIRVYTNHC